jgi:hypothetical protein
MRACFIFLDRRQRRFSLQNQRCCSFISHLSLPLRRIGAAQVAQQAAQIQVTLSGFSGSPTKCVLRWIFN